MAPMREPALIARSRPFLLPVLLLGAWEVGSAAGRIDPLFLPPPTAWIAALAAMAADGSLPADILATLARLGRGFAFGASVGCVLGLVLGSSPRAYSAVNPVVALLHPLPRIALFPILLLLLGIGEAPKTTVVAISAFFPTFITTTLGVRGIDRGLFEVVGSYGASRGLVLRRVVLPGSVPSLLAGARLAFNASLTSTITVELLTAGAGIGSRIWNGWQNLRTAQLYAAVLLIAVFGLLSNLALQALQRRLTPWRTVP